MLPGGETRAVTSYPPYPVIITEGHGARLTDADGHVYLDLVNNYTAMVHGSAFGPAVEAVADLLPRGYAFASPHPYQVALAELHRGAGATVGAGAVYQLGYRGGAAGGQDRFAGDRAPAAAYVRRGVPRQRDAVLLGSPDAARVPWNDMAAVTALLDRPGHDIAAVFAEPFLGASGVRPAEPGFLAAVAGLARDRGALFVLDEVQGLRNGPGGEQGRLGLTPDLTLLGKIIGGGFPIGAVGGRADLLELTVAAMTPGYVTQRGHLQRPPGRGRGRPDDAAAPGRGRGDHAAERGGRGAGLAHRRGSDGGRGARRGHPGRSIMNVHLRDPGQLADLHLALLLNGVYTTPRGMINLSTAVSPGDLDDIAAAYAAAFTQIRPA